MSETRAYDNEDRLVNWESADPAIDQFCDLSLVGDWDIIMTTTSASSPTYTYVYASYIDEPVMRGGSGGLRYYHRNQQYSITALTDGGGTITERYAYSAYGTPTITNAAGTTRTSSADNNRYTYTSREYDEALDLYHYRARMYAPVAGRFCSRDPIGYVDTNNLYRNFFGLAKADPLGLFGMGSDPMTPKDVADCREECAKRGQNYIATITYWTDVFCPLLPRMHWRNCICGGTIKKEDPDPTPEEKRCASRLGLCLASEIPYDQCVSCYNACQASKKGIWPLEKCKLNFNIDPGDLPDLDDLFNGL